MKIMIAKSAGFCFGVERAVKQVYRLIDTVDEKTKIYTVGQLIHNPHIINELSEHGVITISPDDIDGIYDRTNQEHKSIIVIRTHGVERQVSEKLAAYTEHNPFFTVCDLTCPYVKKIHDIVSSNKDRQLIILGDASHPEVVGIRSYSDGETLIFGNASEIAAVKGNDKPTIAVAQTTQNTLEWKKSQNIIKKVYTNSIIFDTICSVTENRQREADEMSKKADLMLVIGGRDSSNTNKLYDTARKNLGNTFFVESPSELPDIKVTPDMKIGITAGASTPGVIIQEVKKQMTELENKNTETGEVVGAEDFAGMLEDSLVTLNTGETVSGVITSISSNELHVDIGAKVTGIIPLDEVSNDSSFKLDEAFKVGDKIEAMLIKYSDRDGVATLSKKRIDNILNWRKLLNAYKDGTILEGKVVEAIKGGVILEVDSQKLFVPASQSGVSKDGDLSSIVGMTKKVKIIDVNEGRKRAVASIRAVDREERKNREAAFWDSIEIGKQYEGEVKSLTSYGAFVDLGGVDGMVHSSELSWKHIKHPSEVVSVGETLKVYVKDFDREAKRISLGYKTEESNPWTIFTGKYTTGDVAEVKIVSLMPFGAFAEVVPGTDGLIHISQITDHMIAKPADVLEIGQTVKAKITDIDQDKHKISLSIRALIEDEKKAENEAAPDPAE